MGQAIDKQARAQIAGVIVGASEAIGGYRRGADEAWRGVDVNFGKELEAERAVSVSQVDAAGQIRNASIVE